MGSSLQTVIFNALSDIGVIGFGESETPAEAVSLCLSKANLLIGRWNLRRALGDYEYTQVFTLPSSANSYSLGAAADSPDIAVTGGRAPLKIDSAKRVTSDSTPIETEIPVLPFEEWNRLAIPALSATLPQAVYLQSKPVLPLLWVYPKPASGQKLRLSWRNLMSEIAIGSIDTAISWRDGVEDAFTKTLAEDLSVPFRKPIGSDLQRLAREARSEVFAMNSTPPILRPDVPLAGEPSGIDKADFYSRTW